MYFHVATGAMRYRKIVNNGNCFIGGLINIMVTYLTNQSDWVTFSGNLAYKRSVALHFWVLLRMIHSTD